MPPECPQLHEELTQIKKLQQEFDSVCQKEIKEGYSPEVDRLQNKLQEKIAELRDQLWPLKSTEVTIEEPGKEPYQKEIDLKMETIKNQYESQKQIYQEVGILQKLSGSQSSQEDQSQDQENLGIIGPDPAHPEDPTKTKVYSFPTWQEVQKQIRANKKLFQEKLSTMEKAKILIIPFAQSIQTLANIYEKVIKEKHNDDPNKNKLKGANGDDLNLDKDKPVYLSDDYNDPDNLRYFPQWVKDSNNIIPQNGITKAQATEQFGAWQIKIIEDSPLATEENQGKTIRLRPADSAGFDEKKRQQVEGGQNTQEQYDQIRSLNEQGLTLEHWLTHAILHLKEKDRVLDDDRGAGYYVRLTGTNFIGSDYVPGAFWFRDFRRANLDSFYPDLSLASNAVRSTAGA